MKKIILLLAIVLSVYGCSSDSDSEPISYAGNWTGTYTGTGDNGTFDIIVSSTGVILGTATSVPFAESYDLSGTVSSTGGVVATFGTSSIGGTFTGQLNNTTASGTWLNNIPDPDISGTWTGEKQ